MSNTILLCTLNARYFHASLGLRYLLANLPAELQAVTRIEEFVINQKPQEIAERLLAQAPSIIGFGVYIWNVRETEAVIAILKTVRPEVPIVLGGPEVSHETEEQSIVKWADFVITGPGEATLPQLCRQLLAGQPPPQRKLSGRALPIGQIQLPYAHYSDNDIANRFIYVEASRGCPFRCEFCLSALDRSTRAFPLEPFLTALEQLWQRGVRHFKFVDRTFNLNPAHSHPILEFFLERVDAQTFLHFELVPDRLPQSLKTLIARFPAGTLQFEIGIQTFGPEVQARISRQQDASRTEANLRWLRQNSHAHLHADLIIGLPGEDMASFGRGFDRLYALGPHEIQVGILKRLRGAPISRHTAGFGMHYNPLPPYNLLANDCLDFATMQRLSRFARYWDLVGNSGRFARTLPLLLAEAPFDRFLAFSDWLYARTHQTHQIALDRLYDLVFEALSGPFQLDPADIRHSLGVDYMASGSRGSPQCLQTQVPSPARTAPSAPASPGRQARHRTHRDTLQ